ncbi:DUF6283 family protein [Streptomyces sp. NPDC088768]|uniref:DUF6283 family protein n=1 Tax=Streptomyces sp. NPDC088768 TaxID=3365894 RepID=UPI003819093C
MQALPVAEGRRPRRVSGLAVRGAARHERAVPRGRAGPDAPLFACHKTPEGREKACAGWLAAVGHRHLGVRLAVTQGRLPAQALTPGESWPPLFAAYEEMATTQAGEDR